MRINQAPAVQVRILENLGEVRGIGESGTPLAAPVLANTVFAMTGQRVRELPMSRHVTIA